MKKAKRSKTITITLTDHDWQDLIDSTAKFNEKNKLEVSPTTVAAGAYRLGFENYFRVAKLDKPSKG